jgi:hypothetical protein
MLVKLRSALLLLSLALAGCAAHAQGVSDGSKPSAEALSARPIPWKTGSLQLVAEDIRHLQVIITPGFQRGQHFAWFTAGGREVVVVFSGSSTDIDEMSNELNGRYYPEQGLPGDRRSFVILGSLKGPGNPPDPGPGGFPEAYVVMVMRAAFDANIMQIHLDEARIPQIETTKTQ